MRNKPLILLIYFLFFLLETTRCHDFNYFTWHTFLQRGFLHMMYETLYGRIYVEHSLSLSRMLKGIPSRLSIGMFANVCALYSLHSLLLYMHVCVCVCVCVSVFLVLFSQSAIFSFSLVLAAILFKYKFHIIFLACNTSTQFRKADGRLHQ